MTETTDAQRLTAIALLVVPLTCTSDDHSVIAGRIWAIAGRRESPEEALGSLGPDWADALADYHAALERDARPSTVAATSPAPRPS